MGVIPRLNQYVCLLKLAENDTLFRTCNRVCVLCAAWTKIPSHRAITRKVDMLVCVAIRWFATEGHKPLNWNTLTELSFHIQIAIGSNWVDSLPYRKIQSLVWLRRAPYWVGIIAELLSKTLLNSKCYKIHTFRIEISALNVVTKSEQIFDHDTVHRV